MLDAGVTRIGAAIAVLLSIASPAAAPSSSRAAIRLEPHYCLSDALIPTGPRAGVLASVPCREADRIRKPTWRT